MDHIAHQPGLDGQAFHLVNPRGQRAGDVLNTFARAGHAPQMAIRIDKRMTDMLPKGVLSFAMKLPALKDIRAHVLADLGIPDVGDRAHGAGRRASTRATPQRALEGTGIEVPPLESYATKLWDYWERNLDPDLFKDRSFEGAVNGKTVVITGASSGIGRAAALKVAAAGGIPLLVARTQEKLDEVKAEIERDRRHGVRLLRRPRPTTTRSTRWSRRSSPTTPRSTCWSTTPGRSIRRSVALSYDRFHDYERTIQLNYLGTIRLILGLLPHMREQAAPATSSTSPRSACRRTRRASRPTSPPSRRSTRSRAS